MLLALVMLMILTAIVILTITIIITLVPQTRKAGGKRVESQGCAGSARAAGRGAGLSLVCFIS